MGLVIKREIKINMTIYMENLFLTLELCELAKDYGFKEKCIAVYSGLSYPINEGSSEKITSCLYIPFNNSYDEVDMIWIENEDAHFHWHEGTYDKGFHSRCDLVGDEFPAPTWDQMINWFHERKILIEATVLDAWDNWIYKIAIQDAMAPFAQMEWNSKEYKTKIEALTEAFKSAFNYIDKQPLTP